MSFGAIATHPKLDLLRQKQEEVERKVAFLKTVP